MQIENKKDESNLDECKDEYQGKKLKPVKKSWDQFKPVDIRWNQFKLVETSSNQLKSVEPN